jgi:hypothetical protein
LRAEGFSCSLGVLYGGLGISKLQLFIKKIKIKFQQNLDPDPDPDPGSRIRIRDPETGSAIRKNAVSVSGSALNQCGSATLLQALLYRVHPVLLISINSAILYCSTKNYSG